MKCHQEGLGGGFAADSVLRDPGSIHRAKQSWIYPRAQKVPMGTTSGLFYYSSVRPQKTDREQWLFSLEQRKLQGELRAPFRA